MALVLEFVWAYVASFAFSVIFNIRGRKLFFSALGGALAWLVFSGLTPVVPEDIPRYLLATIAASCYAEAMARLHRVPVTVYLAVGIIPLVPGNGIYTTMKYCISGESQLFLDTGLHTFAIAGSLALGIVLVTSLVRLMGALRRRISAAGGAPNGRPE